MIKEKAHAKINLFLDVVGKRLDNFHDLETIMAPVELHDVLTFDKSESGEVRLTSSIEITEKPEDNLVYKVAHHMRTMFNIQEGIDIFIEKNIPLSAGLAGGSADAAATLRGINRLFKLGLDNAELSKIGETFGADIPFCVYNELCIARGKGEQLFFLKRKLKCPVLLVKPNFSVSTKQVFQSVDMSKIKNVKITTMSNAIYNKNKELMVTQLHNALEPFTFALFPEVEALKDKLQSYEPRGVLMSGSGPTVFVIDPDKQKLERMRQEFQNDFFTHLTKIK